MTDYTLWTKEDLISEIESLKSTLDQRVSKKTKDFEKKYVGKHAHLIEKMANLTDDATQICYKQIQEIFLEEQRIDIYRGFYGNFIKTIRDVFVAHFGFERCVKINKKLKLLEKMQENIKEYKELEKK